MSAIIQDLTEGLAAAYRVGHPGGLPAEFSFAAELSGGLRERPGAVFYGEDEERPHPRCVRFLLRLETRFRGDVAGADETTAAAAAAALAESLPVMLPAALAGMEPWALRMAVPQPGGLEADDEGWVVSHAWTVTLVRGG